MNESVTKDQTETPERSGNLGLWIGLLLPPAAWAVDVQSLYLTSEYGCWGSGFFWNHVVSLACLLFSVLGGIIAWMLWRSLGAGTEDEGPSPQTRKRFMAIIGMLGGALFSLTILAQWLPTLVGVPCGK